MTSQEPRRRPWPVRLTRWLTRPFTDALVAGVPYPPPPPPAWRRPAAVQRFNRLLPGVPVDIVVVAEILTAIVIFIGTVSMLVDANRRTSTPVDGELLILAGVAAAAPLLLRDRWPLAAWRLSVPSMILVVSVAQQIYTYGGAFEAPYPFGAILMYLLVLYAVGTRCPRHVSVGIWIMSLIGMWIINPAPSVFLGMIMTAAALVYGDNARVRRTAQRRVAEEEQRTEDERAARAVLQERSRIARELHDVVAHHMSVIAIQAEAAPLKASSDAEALKAELAEIRTTALEALAELRRVLGVLREEPGTPAPETSPQPDLSQIDSLLAASRAAGQQVTLTTSGPLHSSLPAIGLTAYRVLQESLSNAMRHAPGAPVRVEIDHGPDRLLLHVENDPPASGPPAAARSRGGQGLAGMRERVSAWGGTVTTGPTAAGGFAVVATLPLDQPDTSGPAGRSANGGEQ